MDVVLYARYRRGGGKRDFPTWEFSAGISSWDETPAPAQVGRRLFEGRLQKKLPPDRAALVNNITHGAHGLLCGALYGITVESLSQPRIWYGLPFGASVWAVDYAVLPAAVLYKPVWEYDRKTLASDLSAHLLYGTVTAATLRLLSPLTDTRVTVNAIPATREVIVNETDPFQQAPSSGSRAGPAAAGPARSRHGPRQGARPPPVPDWRTARPSPRPGGGVRLRDCRLPDRRPGPSLLRGGRYVYGEPAGTAGPPGEGTATDSASPAFRR